MTISSYPLSRPTEVRPFAKGVTLQLFRTTGHATTNLTHRPLSQLDFHPAANDYPCDACQNSPPYEWDAWFRVKNVSYSAVAYVHASSPKADRLALAKLIASIHATGEAQTGSSPRQVHAVTHVLCSGTASHPVMPADTSDWGDAPTCVQISGAKCRVWSQIPHRSDTALRERHFKLRSAVCLYTRKFLAKHPRGYVVEPLPQHLVLPSA